MTYPLKTSGRTVASLKQFISITVSLTMAEFRKRMSGFLELISLNLALQKVRDETWNQISKVIIPVEKSLGRICSSPVVIDGYYPPFDRSLMDGYALDHKSVSQASKDSPVTMKIVGESSPAGMFHGTVKQGECVQIYTGAGVPHGCDCIVMAEYGERQGNTVTIRRSASPSENMSRTGEDMSPGEIVINQGDIVRSAHIAVSQATGIKEIEVYEKVRISLISTGDELVVLPGQGGMINVTKPLLFNYLRRGFIEPSMADDVPDDTDRVKNAVLGASENADVVVITGGSSIGERDVVPEALSGISRTVFGGARIRPGKTVAVYNRGGSLVVSVSGHPAVALLSLQPFLSEYLRKQTQVHSLGLSVSAVVEERFVNRKGMSSVVRGSLRIVDGKATVCPLKFSSSASVSALLRSNCFFTVGEETQVIEAGETVNVTIMGGVLDDQVSC
ncbi:MAG: molybdopterin molybdotransferase MoeA [Thermoplasmataceae archaeon]